MESSPLPASTKPLCRRADALEVIERLRSAGQVAYFAGGCVRDALLGLSPSDWDVATDAPPRRVRQLFAHTQAVGQAFGVILVRHGVSVVEVATFRSDGRYDDGRRPSEVRFASAEEDARRRDFTINALFLDPLDSDRVIDFVGGVADLHSRVLRAVGDAQARFAEDQLRLLRAIRFAARFNLHIDPATERAILFHGSKLARISPERIADELRRMLPVPSGAWAWDAMFRRFSALADVIFRFLPPVPNIEARQAFRSLLDAMPAERRQELTFAGCLAAITLDWIGLAVAEPVPGGLLTSRSIAAAVQAVRKSLRLSNDESTEMKRTLEGLRQLLDGGPISIADLKRFLASAEAGQARALFDAMPDGAVSHRQPLNARLDELTTTDCAPSALISGDDLTAAGLVPGPAFKRILHEVYDAQLENRVSGRDDAIDMARRIASGTAGNADSAGDTGDTAK